jgi:DNA-binding response OmpR family regulator
VTAASAAEVERMFERLRRGDLIIADYHLEDRKTGLDLLMRAREAVGFELPAVIMSGDLPAVLSTVKSTGVNGCRFLGKPVDPAELLAEIAELGDCSEASAVG